VFGDTAGTGTASANGLKAPATVIATATANSVKALETVAVTATADNLKALETVAVTATADNLKAPTRSTVRASLRASASSSFASLTRTSACGAYIVRDGSNASPLSFPPAQTVESADTGGTERGRSLVAAPAK